MKLQLTEVENVTGIYKIKGAAGQMPRSACRLAPAAARNFSQFLGHMVTVSDMFRSPESSLNAVKAGRGAKAPGYSGHNYGFSIDIDVTATMVAVHAVTKEGLDAWMKTRGWFCHRQDHKRDREEWHYNYFGVGFELPKGVSSSTILERMIVDNYGGYFSLSNKEAQTALKRIGLYGGDIDGLIGPRTRTAIQLFQKTWDIPQTGVVNSKTERTLVYVTADIELVGAV